MEIYLEKLAFDLDFHPLENLVSAALINGDLLLYRFSSDSTPQKVSEVHAHTKSCRAVHFIDDGRSIVIGSPDRLILATDVEIGGTIAHLEDAHGEAINKIINLHQSKIASRDDGGCIKVWDTRQRSCCGTCQAHEDYVSDMTFVPDAIKLFGDETLSVYLLCSCFSVAGLITYLFVGWYCWINCRMYVGCFFLVDAGLNSIYMTIYGLIVGFTVHLLDKTCVLTGLIIDIFQICMFKRLFIYMGYQNLSYPIEMLASVHNVFHVSMLKKYPAWSRRRRRMMDGDADVALAALKNNNKNKMWPELEWGRLRNFICKPVSTTHCNMNENCFQKMLCNIIDI
ncbi:hypothetical protein UlMin_020200 [Ulmus minor]